MNHQRTQILVPLLDEPGPYSQWLKIWNETIVQQLRLDARTTLLSMTTPDALSSVLLERQQEDLFIVPWSASAQRLSGRAILALLFPLAQLWATLACSHPSLTTCVPLTQLGEWGNNREALSALVMQCPGWDERVTCWTQPGSRRVIVLRQPELHAPMVQTQRARTFSQMDSTLYQQYLRAILQAAFQTHGGERRRNGNGDAC